MLSPSAPPPTLANTRLLPDAGPGLPPAPPPPRPPPRLEAERRKKSQKGGRARARPPAAATRPLGSMTRRSTAGPLHPYPEHRIRECALRHPRGIRDWLCSSAPRPLPKRFLREAGRAERFLWSWRCWSCGLVFSLGIGLRLQPH